MTLWMDRSLCVLPRKCFHRDIIPFYGTTSLFCCVPSFPIYFSFTFLYYSPYGLQCSRILISRAYRLFQKCTLIKFHTNKNAALLQVLLVEKYKSVLNECKAHLGFHNIFSPVNNRSGVFVNNKVAQKE